MRTWIKSAVVCLLLGAAVVAGTAHQISAQSDPGPWTQPVNVSRSGAASQPAVAVSPDGTLHALWWDAIRGEQYARTTNISSTAWTEAQDVPGIIGGRSLDTATGQINLIAPERLQLVSGLRNTVHALWYNSQGSLQAAQFTGANWGSAITLTLAPGAIATMADASGTLHLTYLKRTDDVNGPAGVYYRVNEEARWTAGTLVHASPYFRTANAGDVYISVAGDGQEHVIATWNDPRTRQSLYARSVDAGSTWSEPVVVSGTQGSLVNRLNVAATPDGRFLLLWQEAGAPGCGITQRESTDSGLSWGAPQRVLGDLTACEASWSFVPGRDGDLWLKAFTTVEGSNANIVTLARRHNGAWSTPRDITVGFLDATSQQFVDLSCLNANLIGETIGVIGCDARGDVWAARNRINPAEWVAIAASSWQPIEFLTDLTSPNEIDGLTAAADLEGNVCAVWSQSSETGRQGTVLYAALQTRDRWSRAVRLFQESDTAISSAARDNQPAATTDSQGHVHLVWSSGTGNAISYSRVDIQDVTSSTSWATPVDLPVPAGLSQWPDIVADASGNRLYVVYVVPFNEKRGVYLVRSDDGGANWSQPSLIFDAVAAQWESVDKPRLTIDRATRSVHAVWRRAATPSSAAPQAVLHAFSTDDGQSWSTPVEVAQGTVDWPRIAASESNQVYVTWLQPALDQSEQGTAFEVWGSLSTDGGRRWSSASIVRGFDRVSDMIDLVSDDAGRLYLAGIGQAAGGESTIMLSEWDGQTWHLQDSFGLGQAANPGNAVKLAIAPAAGRLSALLRSQIWDQTGTAQFEVSATNRPIAASSPVIPAPTFTPIPPPGPTPTLALPPTPTPRPQLPASNAKPLTQGGGPPPLVLGGILAAGIVIAVVARTIWVRRQHL